MARPTCDDVAGLLPEAALGTLGRPEQRAVAAHLGSCARCRADAAADARVVAALAAAAAPADPPAGFRARALARMGAPAAAPAPVAEGPVPTAPPAPSGRPEPTGAPARPRRRRLVVALAAAAAAAALAAAGVATATRSDDPAPVAEGPAPTRTADLVGPGGTSGGSVTLPGDVPSMAVQLDRLASGTAYRCEVVLADGTVVAVAGWPAGPYRAGGAAWEAPLPDGVGGADVRQVRVVGTDGTTLAADLT